MKIGVVCENSLEDKLILNLISKNISKYYKNNVCIDLFIFNNKSSQFESVFYKSKEWNKVVAIEFTIKFLKLTRVTNYDFFCDISNSFKTFFLSKIFITKKKISVSSNIFDLAFRQKIKNPKQHLNLFIKEIIPQNHTIDYYPKIDFDESKNNDLVKWIFETSSLQSFSKTKFLLLYYDVMEQKDEKMISDIIKLVNDTFKTKIILIINSNKNNSFKIYENLDENLKSIVIKNFINCEDYVQTFLILKRSNFLISNNKNITHIYKYISGNKFVEIKKKIKPFFFNLLKNDKQNNNNENLFSKISKMLIEINN
jgi:hypothetical protein